MNLMLITKHSKIRMDDICNDVLLTISLRFCHVIRQNGGNSEGTILQRPMERLTTSIR